MLFSNPRFFELPPEEFNAQQEQLKDLRDEHYRQMVQLGTAERALGSLALSNLYAKKSSFTEGTLLYPFRKPQWNLPLMQSEEIYADAKINRSQSLMRDPYLEYFGDKKRENFVLCIGRYEPESHGGYSTSAYAAGLVQDPETAAAIGRERYIPFPGMEELDLHLIQKQLSEIAAFAVEKGLEIIDPLTLAEGQGPIIGYEDGDFAEAGY
jgi:hypothetical protein